MTFQFSRRISSSMAEIEKHALRSRKRRRDDTFEEDPSNGNHAAMRYDEMPTTNTPRKGRSGNEANKRFECRHEGCGKSYSRAEHLHRHQLNRESAQHSYIAAIQLMRIQMLLNKSSNVISQDVPEPLFGRTFALATENVTLTEPHNTQIRIFEGRVARNL